MKQSILFSAVALTMLGTSCWLLAHRHSESLTPTEKSSIYDARFEEEREGKYEAEEHQGAAQWFGDIRMNQTTHTWDAADYYKAVEQANILAAQSRYKGFPLVWEELGPDNVGGRCRAILVDKRDHNTIYAGGVSGGLWKSTTAGSSWEKVNDFAENLAVTSITQTPNGDIFYGTGEQTFTALSNGTGNSGQIGGGIFKSTDGTTFSLLSSTKPTSSARWTNVQSLAADPTNNRVYAGTMNGLWYSDNGGTSWQNSGVGSAVVKEIKVDTAGNIYCVMGNSIFKSDYSLSKWTKLGQGTIPTANSRISIAVSKSDLNYVYCMVASTSETLEGIYQSKDGGATWSRIAKSAANSFDFDPLRNPGGQAQGNYDNVIAVDPTNPEHVFAAGVQWWDWTPSNGWKKTAQEGGALGVSTIFLHSDKHAIVFDTESSPYRTYIGSDGGIAISEDGGQTFKTSNRKFNVTQFYSAAMNKNGWVSGGTQDNGTLIINGNGNTKQSAFSVFGGDGFQTEFSSSFPNIVFVESYYGGMARSANNGQTFNQWYSPQLIHNVDRRYGYTGSSATDDKRSDFSNIFNTPFVLSDHESPDSASTFVIGMNNNQDGNFNQYGGAVFLTHDALRINREANWYKVWGNDNAAPPKNIGLSENGNWMYVSCYGFTGSAYTGQLWRVRNLNTAVYDTAVDWDWSTSGIVAELLTPSFNGRAVTSVNWDPNDSNTVLVTLGNYGNTDYIYITHNALDTINPVQWTDVTGNLPNMPVYDIKVSNDNSNDWIIGTELGIWVSHDGGAKWQEENNGLARVPVLQIKQYEYKPWEGPTFVAATHGRGIYKTSSLTTSVQKTISNGFGSVKAYPNPADNYLNIEMLFDKPGNVLIEIMDLQGRIVRKENLGYKIGGGGNFPISVGDLTRGHYILRVQNPSGVFNQKITVVH